MGELTLDEPRDRPAVVLHALEVDAEPDHAATGVSGVPLDTLVAVRDAQDAAGSAAEFSSGTAEHFSEAVPQGVDVVGGDGHEGGSLIQGGERRRALGRSGAQ